MIQLMPLHWGQVNLEIFVDGLDPASGRLEAESSSSTIKRRFGKGTTLKLLGRGGKTKLTGRGR